MESSFHLTAYMENLLRIYPKDNSPKNSHEVGQEAEIKISKLSNKVCSLINDVSGKTLQYSIKNDVMGTSLVDQWLRL